MLPLSLTGALTGALGLGGGGDALPGTSQPAGTVTGPATGGDVNVGGLNVPAYSFADGGPGGVSFDAAGGFADKVLIGVAVAAAVGLLLVVVKKAAK